MNEITLETREQRGQTIATLLKIRQSKGVWIVPSQTLTGTYRVEVRSDIELKPQDWWPRLYRGIALAEMGRKREAINEYLIGSELNPKFKSFYFRRWLLYRELNETELAQRDLEAGNAILDEPDELRPRDPRDPAVARADEKIRKLMEESRSEK